RYADDAVLYLSSQSDAARVMDVLPKRFARYGLRLHPMKTKMVCFKPPCHSDSDGNNRSFDLLGFTHVWGRSRRGRWIVQQHTAKDRFSRALRNTKRWLIMHRHQPVAWQHQKLSAKLRGHYAYYGISGNARQLKCMRFRVERLWIKWLGRRSQRAKIRWKQANRLLERYALPSARPNHVKP